MSMIEGVGDEVTQFFVVVVVVVLGLTAWWSTNIAERPLFRTVLILERRSRNRAAIIDTTQTPSIAAVSAGSTENSIDTGQDERIVNGESVIEPEGVPVEDNKDDGDTINIIEAAATTTESRREEVEGTGEEMTLMDDSDSVRRNRLAYFQSRTSRSPVADDQLLLKQGIITERDESAQSVDCSPSEMIKEAENIRIRLKYLNDDQKLVEGKLQEPLGDFKRRHFSPELSADKLVRLIFNGRVLQSEARTLAGHGLFDNCVVHCLVHTRRSGTSGGETNPSPHGTPHSTGPTHPHHHHADWNLGTLLYACLGAVLGFAWYCRFQFGQLFTMTTTAALFGLTGIFVVSIIGVYMPDQEPLVGQPPVH